MKKRLVVWAIVLIAIHVHAQQKDSLIIDKTTSLSRPETSITATLEKINERRKTIRSLMISGSLITYGFIALENDNLIDLDYAIKNEIRENHPFFHTKIDNYLQYAPAAVVYGLNVIGIKGKNNFRDRSMIYLLANAIMSAEVQSLKAITKLQRPDGFGTNAFPSGHTATAFVAAEFLYQEYKDVSPWYGIAGYAMATATGILRMYNNRHWLKDIVAGAGFGILSARVAYWLYPAIKKRFFKNKPARAMILPYYQNSGCGISLVYNLTHIPD
jgi:hypothetical protein